FATKPALELLNRAFRDRRDFHGCPLVSSALRSLRGARDLSAPRTSSVRAADPFVRCVEDTPRTASNPASLSMTREATVGGSLSGQRELFWTLVYYPDCRRISGRIAGFSAPTPV